MSLRHVPVWKRLVRTGVFALLASAIIPAASAVTIISNYPPVAEFGCCTIFGSATRSFGVGFTMPAGAAYTLDSVTLRLRVAAAGGTFTMQLFGGSPANPSGAALATFTVPTLNTVTTGTDLTLTTSSPVVLQPGQTYWVVAYALVTGSPNQIEWNESAPSGTPTGIAASNGTRFNTPALVPPTGVLAGSPIFQVNGTIVGTVPAVSTAGLGVCTVLLMVGGLLAMRRRDEMAG